MENFGLGLVLNFQDNATSKIDAVVGMMENLQKSIDEVVNSASGSIQSITGMSNALLTLGAGITALGGAGVATFTSLTKNIVNMGSQFERNIMALTQMYGNAQVARDKFIAYERMAASTPLGMEVIQSAATRLKTVGVEAEKTFNVLVDGTKKSRALLEVLGDLSVMRPDKSMDDVIREGIEFIEGNARPIKMSFGLDVKSESGLNEKLASTAEGRLDQLVRMIEKAGYTGALDKTNETWDTIMQNLGDNFKVLSYYVGMVGGVFEEVKAPFKELFKYLNNLLDQKGVMEDIGKSIANGLRVVIAPAMAVLGLVNKLIVSFVELTKEHPKIVSFGIAFLGVASQITLVAGVGLVALGVFLKLRVMVIKLIADFRTFIATTRFAGMSFGMLLRSILPVTIALGFLYYAWKTNFLGLRTIVGGTLQYLANLFDIVADAMTHIDIEKGIFSLTKKHHNLAEEMGIMGLLQTLATAYHYAVLFGRGMQEGFANAQQVISDINTKIDNFLKSLSGTPLEGFANDIKKVKEDFTTMFNPQTANDIQYLGKVFGELAVYAGILAGAFVVLKPVFSLIRSVIGVVSSVVGAIIRVVEAVRNIYSSVSNFIGLVRNNPMSRILLGSYALVITAILAVVAVIKFLVDHWKTVKEVAEIVWNHIVGTIQGVIGRITPIFDRLKQAWLDLVAKFPILGEVVDTVVGVVTAIFGFFTGELSVSEETASEILNTLGAVFEFVFDLVATVVEVAIGVVASVLTGLFTVLGGVIDFIKGVFTGNWTQAWEGVKKIFSGIWDTIKGIAENTIGAISGFLDRVIGKAGDAQKAAQEANASLPEPVNNALGGIYSRPLLTWVAEAGYPEAIIPLNDSARGVALWEQAGRMLGTLPDSLTSAEEVTAPIPTPAPVRTIPIPVPVSAPQPAQAPSDGGITFEAGSIQFNVTTDNFDADKAAQMIMPIIQRKLEIMRMTSRQGGALV